MATKLELGVRCAFRKKPQFLHKQRYTEIEYDGFGPKVLGIIGLFGDKAIGLA